MAVLVCDICGGKLTMGSGGLAVCDSCGIEHTKERMQEKVQEIKGIVRVDNSHMVENYLSLAQNAYDSSNQAEAESYCNKIIEIDPNHYRAWMLKGKSAGWQSTLQNPRFAEAVSGFSKSIINAPEGERDAIIEESKGELKKLISAIISLRGDRFAKWPNNDEVAGFINDVTQILNAMTQFVRQSGISIPQSDVVAPIAFQINQAVNAAWSGKILPDYKGGYGRPNDYEWRAFIDRVEYCIILLKMAIDLRDADDEVDIQLYENLIHLHSEAIDSCSWDYKITDYGKSWYKHYTLTAEAIRIRRNLISQYDAKISEIEDKADREKEEKRKEAIKRYWEAHADEKARLDAENQDIIQQIATLNKEAYNVPGKAEYTNIRGSISKLEAEKKTLGIFKGKEKKVIQEQIDAATTELSQITLRVNNAVAAIGRKIELLKKQQAEIKTELTKPR